MHNSERMGGCAYISMKTTYKLIIGLVLVILVAGGGYYAWQSNAAKGGLANLSASSKLTDSQVSELVSRISKFLVVPNNENPSVVVIKDAAQLAAQQSFYKDAKDGDVLIVYSTRAIIYDIANNKLVNVGPIVRNDTPPAESPTASASASVSPSVSATPAPKAEAIKVDVRNGTSTAGLAGAAASTIKKNKLFTIGVVGDAKGAYTETVIIDFTTAGSGKAAAVQELATLLKAKVVTTLPANEPKSTADALVIVGK
jgi:hypothetical protein